MLYLQAGDIHPQPEDTYLQAKDTYPQAKDCDSWPARPGFRIISTPPSQARCDTSSLPHFSLSLSLHFKQIESGILCGIRHKIRFYTRAFNHERDVWKKHPDGLCRCSAICRHSSPINNSRCLFRKKPQHTPGYPVRCG